MWTEHQTMSASVIKLGIVEEEEVWAVQILPLFLFMQVKSKQFLMFIIDRNFNKLNETCDEITAVENDTQIKEGDVTLFMCILFLLFACLYLTLRLKLFSNPLNQKQLDAHLS